MEKRHAWRNLAQGSTDRPTGLTSMSHGGYLAQQRPPLSPPLIIPTISSPKPGNAPSRGISALQAVDGRFRTNPPTRNPSVSTRIFLSCSHGNSQDIGRKYSRESSFSSTLSPAKSPNPLSHFLIHKFERRRIVLPRNCNIEGACAGKAIGTGLGTK